MSGILKNGFVLLLLSAALASGCSSTLSRHHPEELRAAPRPAYSVALQQADMAVAVSPVRQTLQIGGSIGTVLGAGISAVQDGQYGAAVRDVLGDYDAGAVFREGIERRLQASFVQAPLSVAPMGTTAGYANAREARQARLDGLRRAGLDVVLDLDLSYGIYGAEGILATRIAGELIDVPSGRALWRNTITRYSVDLFADTRWNDPMQRMTPNVMAPRLLVGKDAVDQWTADGGEHLKRSFEASVEATIQGVLVDLGLDKNPEGLYTLGANALLKGDYKESAAFFKGTLEHEPTHVPAANGLAVALARNKQLDEALTLAETTAAAAPDYMPLAYNLAFWLAVERKQPDQARPYYERALALGAVPSRRLARAMQ